MRKLFKIDSLLTIEKLSDVFRDEPKIIRVNEFTEKSLEQFEEEMDEAHSTGQPIIPIVVDSFGGGVYAALGMIAAIESAKVPVATILSSKAMSAGAILFMCGADGHRYMHPEAVMMIHDVGSFTSGKVEEIKADAKHLDALNDRIYKRISRKLGKPEAYIGDLIKKQHHVDWFLNAKECKKFGFANHLRIPSFEIEISLSMSLK